MGRAGLSCRTAPAACTWCVSWCRPVSLKAARILDPEPPTLVSCRPHLVQSPGGIRRQLPEAMAWTLGLSKMGLADAADWTQAEIGEPSHPAIRCAVSVPWTAR